MSQIATPTKQPAAAAPKPNQDLMTSAPSLMKTFAERYQINPDRLLDSLRMTCFRQKDKDAKPVTNEQMIALLVVANQYKLNPFTREIYAFPTKEGGIVPILGVDGWMRITNEHPQFNGMRFEYGPSKDILNNKDEYLRTVQEWVDCIMYRKDRDEPIVVREYYVECTRDTGPWREMPRRMLRHKAMMQCARYAFGFAGVYDEDDAEAIDRHEAAEMNNSVEKLPSGRVHHRKPHVVKQEEKPATTETVDQDGEVIDVVSTPTNSNEEILRQDLIEHIETILQQEDASQKVLADVGERLDRQRDLLGPDEYKRLSGLWVGRCEVKQETAPAPKKRLF